MSNLIPGLRRSKFSAWLFAPRNLCDPGGYGIVFQFRGEEREFSDGFHSTTNNRMEMMYALIALERLKFSCNVILHSDSQYSKMRRPLTEGGKQNGWITADKKPVKNVDLWKRLDLAASRHNVRWNCSGHAGHRETNMRQAGQDRSICGSGYSTQKRCWFLHKLMGKYLPIILYHVSYPSSG
ncbi:RNase H family protein [Klebsiella pneumoniae]|uniref:RNase H family protein n=1 Tax=Klebsiella pneumoniae TaxID=573 RepID=UPI0039709132